MVYNTLKRFNIGILRAADQGIEKGCGEIITSRDHNSTIQMKSSQDQTFQKRQ